MKIDIEYLKRNDLIVFEAMMGSHAYGTNTLDSDIDIRGVFIQDIDSILGMGYVEQVSDDKNDTTYYEIRRFIELVAVNNPNIIELLNVPEDCILIKNPVMDELLSDTSRFITKKCRGSFGGYAIQQIRKARGLNKMMNWEEHEMVRKGILDFCYVIDPTGKGTIPFNEFLENLRDNEPQLAHVTQKSFGLSKLEHARDCYNMYFIENEDAFKVNPEYAGLVSDPETSNDVHLTSFSKGCPYVATIAVNLDGYSSHCDRYSSYQDWLKHRNQKRVDMNKSHGKKYDGKNMMHCVRLLTMSNEIAEGKGIIVRRTPDEVKKLLSIKRGEYDYDDIIKEAEDLIVSMNQKYDVSRLPYDVDHGMLNDVLIKIRKKRYGIKYVSNPRLYQSDKLTLVMDDVVAVSCCNRHLIGETMNKPVINIAFRGYPGVEVDFATYSLRDAEYREIVSRMKEVLK